MDRNERLLAISNFVNTIGMGLYLSAGTIFLVRSAGLTPAEAGLGLTIGSLIGLAAGSVLGDVADRRGARGTVVVCMMLEAVASLTLLVVADVTTLVIASALAASSRAGTQGARGALIALVAEEGGGPRLRRYLRAVTNVGLAVGAVGAGVVLAVDTRSGYVAMICVDAGTFVVGAVILARLPRFAPTGGLRVGDPLAKRWPALHDLKYLAFTVTCSVASLQYYVLIVAVPLWVTSETEAPKWLPAGLFYLASMLVAVMQVPMTRSIDGPRAAARLLTRSGPVFLIAWCLFALSSGHSMTLAVVMLVTAVSLHSLAEVWQAGGAFELSFSLARPEAQGQYQGLFGVGQGLAAAFAPVTVVSLCIMLGTPGWIVLGLLVWLASMAASRIGRTGASFPGA